MNELVLKRIDEIIALLKHKNDDKGMNLLLDTLNKAVDYVSVVTKMEIQMKTQKFRLEVEDYQDLVMSLDKKRTMSHEALISNCTIFNRYYKKNYPEEFQLGGIFGVKKEKLENFNRQLIGDWAVDITSAIFNNREIVNLKSLNFSQNKSI